MKRRLDFHTGSTLLVVMLLLAILAMVIGAYYQTLPSKYRDTYQATSWQEALHGAEAGVDVVLRQLNSWAETTPDPDAYPWGDARWTLDDAFPLNGTRTLGREALPVLGGSNRVRVSAVAVDVYTRQQAGTNAALHPWFRIRSTARANLPGRYAGTDSRDTRLRRMKLGARKDGAADPHVTRTVEVIAAPRYRFSRALTTTSDMTLGLSANWKVDSFDSGDPQKSEPGTSAGGIYPASRRSEIQANGNVASAKMHSDPNTFGPLINGNGAIVKGSVQTVGGDDPATPGHENVSGSQNMDAARIRDDFIEEILPVSAPVWTTTLAPPPGNTGFATGPHSTPARYVVTGNLGTFEVAAPPAGTTGYVEIIVTGHLKPGSGSRANITIPPNVYAKLYVHGDVELSNAKANATAGSSLVASHLVIYGVGSSGSYTATGNHVGILCFHGPNYDAALHGTVETHGSIVARSFRVLGGGNGGLHYDEALGRGGDITGWQAVGYFEDTRSDL